MDQDEYLYKEKHKKARDNQSFPNKSNDPNIEIDINLSEAYTYKPKNLFFLKENQEKNDFLKEENLKEQTDKPSKESNFYNKIQTLNLDQINSRGNSTQRRINLKYRKTGKSLYPIELEMAEKFDSVNEKDNSQIIGNINSNLSGTENDKVKRVSINTDINTPLGSRKNNIINNFEYEKINNQPIYNKKESISPQDETGVIKFHNIKQNIEDKGLHENFKNNNENSFLNHSFNDRSSIRTLATKALENNNNIFNNYYDNEKNRENEIFYLSNPKSYYMNENTNTIYNYNNTDVNSIKSKWSHKRNRKLQLQNKNDDKKHFDKFENKHAINYESATNLDMFLNKGDIQEQEHTQKRDNVEDEDEAEDGNENDLDQYKPLKSDEYFISKVDKIYHFIDKSEKPNPFHCSNVILFFINCFNLMLVWTMSYVMSEFKNNYYCYDRNSGSINICYQEYFCNCLKKSPPNLAYISDDFITDENELIEIINLNKYFRYVLDVEAFRYSEWNKKKLNHTLLNLDYFNIVFAINKNENWNFFTYYNLACSRTKIMILLAIIIVFALLAFSFVFSYLADIQGRKPILIVMITLQIFGLLIIALFDYPMLKQLKEVDEKSYNLNFNKSMITNNVNFKINQEDYDSRNITDIYFVSKLYNASLFSEKNDYYLEMTTAFADIKNKTYFKLSDYELEYQKSFIYYQTQNHKTLIRRSHFFDNKIYFFFGVFLSFGGCPVIYNLCLTLILEKSLNLSTAIENYKFFTTSYILGFLVPYFLLYFLDSYKLAFFIFAAFQLFFLILFTIFTIESPRYSYEISDWNNIKKFINSLLKNKYIKQKHIKPFIRNRNDKELVKELFFERDKCKLLSQHISKNIIFSFNLKKFDKFYYKYKAGLIDKIKFQNLLKFPFLNYYLIFKSKVYRNYNLVVLSMVFNLSLTLFLIQNKFSSDLVIKRSSLYNNHSILLFNVLNFIIMLLSNIFFHWLEQIYGYPIVMSLCYFLNIIFSLCLAIGNLNKSSNVDLNMEQISTSSLWEGSFSSNNVILLMACSFFAHGIYFPFFLYITKFTKTIYRTTFYGFIHMFILAIWMICVPLSQFFQSNYFFSCLSSLVGFLISYFVINNQDEILVQDFRRLVLDKN